MHPFEKPTKIKTQLAIVNDGEATLEECIALANANGWWKFGQEKAGQRGARWLFIKVANRAILQDQYKTLKSQTSYPPEVYFKSQT